MGACASFNCHVSEFAQEEEFQGRVKTIVLLASNFVSPGSFPCDLVSALVGTAISHLFGEKQKTKNL